MHIAAVLKRKGTEIITASPDDRIDAVARKLAHHKIGAVLIMKDDGRPAGILSERDIVRAVAADGAAALERPVGDLMTRDLVTGSPADTVSQIMGVMTQRRIRHLPILENGELVGLVSIGDIVKARLDDAELEVESLRGYVAGMG
ncbi:CBS domain-containing protein (plasmid) [Azospirillum brasilense]|uniref:CBS domain-containing protein n=1 Tax=Azospirillum brasilense TaxID=192 RepID=A0A4D8R8H2_AZOBR|nr:CBS domain-containing protein [Azospirillum brasilense]QCO17824.1 CBS domain-containing protein [Azospirillum brasilense]